MNRTATCILLATIAVASASSAPIVMKFTFAGSDAGTNTFEKTPDGSFTSKTKLHIMTTTIDSTLKGRFAGKKLISFVLDQTAPPGRFTIRYDKGKYKVSGLQNISGKLVLDTTALFSTYHPQLIATVADALGKGDAARQNMKVFFLENLLVKQVPVGIKTAIKVRRGSDQIAAKVLSMALGPIDLDYPVDGANRVLGMDVPVQKFQGVVEGYSDVFLDPVAKFTELSQPTHETKKIEAVKVPMRDGVNLVADIVMPAEEGKYPVILSRTPYGRQSQLIGAEWWAKRGYIVVAQDVRGRHDSEGTFNPFMTEREDGYDTIDWISKQPWCDGNVGMIGASYAGLVQWAAAVERHPALKCIVPQVSPPDAFFNIPYDHGIFMLWGSLWWSNIVKDKVTRMELATAAMKNADKIKILPLSKLDNAILGRNIAWYDEWLKKDRPSQFKGFDYGKDMSKVEIPALHISGWWDGDGIGTKLNWAAMARAGHTNQWLIYGPWTHAFNTSSRMGDVNYGAGAILEMDSLYLRWFDTWLKGKDVGLGKMQPKVDVFVTGANKWRALNGWPDPASRQMTLYLGLDSGTAAGARGNGKLAIEKGSKKAASIYDYDPARVELPPELKRDIDLSSASTCVVLKPGAKDFLIFKTAPMKEALEIGGPIQLDLYFSTSAKDTDFFATLVDIDPKGVMHAIGQPGKIRAKYLSGWETPRLLTPGKTYEAKIDLWDTAHRFKPGHRLGLIVMSQMFPMYARNLGTGEPDFSGTRMVTAHQKIWHDVKRPSALTFYVLPAKK